MSHENDPRDRLFLVRMWPAQPNAARQSWRGSVQHVATGRKLYISGLADIVEFISAELAESTVDEHIGR